MPRRGSGGLTAGTLRRSSVRCADGPYGLTIGARGPVLKQRTSPLNSITAPEWDGLANANATLVTG